ncbi:hypothetical protein JoomaDRAFT_0737 [Galbibacter orientalis DSM 19592]|uniref:Uncharacterized protein n=1 Tax=Galbibacter orientalis DSM 19592 TaxID=926559 RepID=I3C2C8_9FLAO|nr:hypothetical protein [Galbibacter orientalis]EIJ37771.1 hypothetical protein JoomaDRAFT_0737 [Galbibacter orientalis DSM 19592]
MKRGGGLKALFTRNTVEKAFEIWKDRIEWQIEESLLYAGNEFVNKARLTGRYKDQTGNLRSSIGYMVIKDGQILGERFETYDGKGEEGVKKAKEFAERLASENPRGLMLIGVAGMEYAAAVEAKNFDVITGAGTETEQLLKQLLSKINYT